MKILKKQRQKIKIAQKQLGIDDEAYREMLQNSFNVNSCTQLTVKQADELLDNFRRDVARYVPTENRGKKKYKEFNNRMGNEATGAQMRMLEAMWMEKAREKTETAMNKFILRITKKSHITFLNKKEIQILKKAIESF